MPLLAQTLKLALRFSLREMRGGLSGFLIFLTCIALGVAAIGGVNSVARSITAGVANEGQSLLGGDIRFELNQREVDGRGAGLPRQVSARSPTSANMRSMARLEDGSDQTLVEVKAVDAAYPLYGALVTEPALPRAELFGERSGVFGAAAPDLLFERLGIAPGDAHQARHGDVRAAREARHRARRGFRRLRFRAAADGFARGLAASGLVQPGSLVEHAYKVRLPAGQPSEADLAAIRDQAGEEFPEAGWAIRTAQQRRAVAVLQHRALLAVPDAGRADRAGRRRRRRRQCGARLSRGQARRHRHLQEPRRVGRLRLHRLSRADPDHRRHRHRRSGWCSAR